MGPLGTAASLRQALGRIASPSPFSENAWYYPGTVGAGAMTPGQPRFRVAADGTFRIRIDATDIEVTATTDCVDDEDLDRLQPTLADHTRRAADALARRQLNLDAPRPLAGSGGE